MKEPVLNKIWMRDNYYIHGNRRITIQEIYNPLRNKGPHDINTRFTESSSNP